MAGILKSERYDGLLAFLASLGPFGGAPLGRGATEGGRRDRGGVSVTTPSGLRSLRLLSFALLVPTCSFLIAETRVNCLYIMRLLSQHRCIYTPVYRYPVVSLFFPFSKKQNYQNNTLQMSENVLL